MRRDAETGRLVPNYLLQGLITTLKLSIWATILAMVVGVVIALFRTRENLFLRMVGTHLRRADPQPAAPGADLHLLLFRRSTRSCRCWGSRPSSAAARRLQRRILAFLFAEKSLFVQFISGVITLAFFEGAYIAEIVRAGIESIERGQREAAYSLGLSWFDEMRFVIMPQVIKRVLPPLANEFINTIKYSAIASVVSIQELTFMGRQVVVATRYIFETWITVALLYMVLTLSLSLLASRLERKLRVSD